MNVFADRLFSLLLGWTGTLFNGLWNLFTNNSGGMSDFLRRFWLPLIVILLIFGTMADYIIWFIRWRPHYVWRSWFRKHESSRRLNTTRHYMENLDRSPLDLPEYQDAQAYDDIPMQDEPVYFQFKPVEVNLPEDEAQDISFVPAQFLHEEQQPYVPSLPWEQARQVSREENNSQNCLSPQEGHPENEPEIHYQPLFTREELDNWKNTAGIDDGFQKYEPETQPVSRRRRAGSHRQRKAGFLSSIRDTLFIGEDESTTLDSLPPPIPQEEAFHKPYYPQNYNYRTNPPPGEQQDPPVY